MEKAGGLTGVLADGGMTIFEAADLVEAQKIATDDPTAKSGMLNVEVKMLGFLFILKSRLALPRGRGQCE